MMTKRKSSIPLRQKLIDAEALIAAQKTDIANLVDLLRGKETSIEELRSQLYEENRNVIRLTQENTALTTIAKELQAFHAGEMERLKGASRTVREFLPATRKGITHKFELAGVKGYLNVGLYSDGRPGELFVNIQKEGSTIGGLMDCVGVLTSVALQYGVPLENMVRKFEHQRFEPAGITSNREIPMASSIVDYVFTWLGCQFIPGYRDTRRVRLK